MTSSAALEGCTASRNRTSRFRVIIVQVGNSRLGWRRPSRLAALAPRGDGRTLLRRASRRERHGDHRGPAEQHIDPDQQAECPGRGFWQARKDDAGKDEIDDAACQHPAPASGQPCAMLECEHQRGDALDDEKCDQHQRERNRAADRPADQHDAGGDADQRRQKRPPETRRIAHPERRNQTDRAAEQKQPADKKRKCQRGDDRQNDRRRAEKHENDTLDQEQDPMLADRAHDRAPHVVARLRLIHCHDRLPLNRSPALFSERDWRIAKNLLAICYSPFAARPRHWNGSSAGSVTQMPPSDKALSGRGDLADPAWRTYLRCCDVSKGSVMDGQDDEATPDVRAPFRSWPLAFFHYARASPVAERRRFARLWRASTSKRGSFQPPLRSKPSRPPGLEFCPHE